MVKIGEKRDRAAYSVWRNDEGFDTDFAHHTPVELTVRGSIPTYAAGVLYRTGPGGYKLQTDKGTTYEAFHWFDGFTQVHRFHIQASKDPIAPIRVLYNSRRSVDEMLERIKRTGKFDGFSFGQKRDPCQSFFKKFMSIFTPEPPANGPSSRNVGVTLSVNLPGMMTTQIDGHGTGIKTLHNKTDANALQQIDPETLEPIGLANQTVLHPSLKGPISSAHAKSDPDTGDVYNYNLDLGAHSTYRVFCTSASTGKTEILATFTAQASYIHSFFLTQTYIVLCVWNSFLSMGGASMIINKNMLDSIAPYDPSKPAKWFVIDRRNGQGLVATYESDAFYAFHTVNAWEEASPSDPSKTDIVADVSIYDNLDVLHSLCYKNLLSSKRPIIDPKETESSRPSLRRFRLPDVKSSKTPKSAKVDFTTPKDQAPELPTINPAYLTKAHRFTYGTANRGRSTLVDGLVKFDSATQTAIYWEKFAHSPGEPIFVRNPKCMTEDDGVLLSVVLDGTIDKSYLLCLDAQTMQEMGRAEVDGAIGFGFHGTHVPAGGKYYGGT